MTGSRCRDVENSRAGGLTASSRPCDTAAATSHGDTAATAVPSSRRTAAAASPTADTASATAPRPEVTTGGETSTWCTKRGERRPQPPGTGGEPGHAAAHHAQLRRQAHRPASHASQQAADRPVPPAPGPGLQHLADHAGLIQPPEQQPRWRQHMRHPALRRLALPAAKPVGDRPGRRLLPGRMRLQQHHPPVRAAQPPRRHPAVPAQHPRSARRAPQQPARQLPLDQIPIRGYRQHRRHHPCATRRPSRTPLNDQGGPSALTRRPHLTVATHTRANRVRSSKIVLTGRVRDSRSAPR